ncbi:MAG: hypothetical protein A2663_00880 [Candidatus Buchananbacteria bacterium RIFCSPHIGHO2_01_FULL_46_12]|uniref:Uncharacterized protein n=3 Tax=Candidatus Buchananiibacteriota TaxID=1817903 RepID=A0A1G1Y622_9BACT|nr:MAG: hypothetical protein A2663_00880 [Candidatus Buchananbacteria bacterium RIFCSPHIGHO2_01_FULL_46_12]OGY53676.1 MAG: hypothetical protein A3B15_01975 [Candidatus Buchananbacteria bacterium RIFCSPLOWO2_01_FULL_45_31]OGY56229.1 MAG: hypothetical protein A3H67_03940 [Candidatus Buchananbacteria bacterium RIFCSPLOWO2_02_FULL_46_11b]
MRELGLILGLLLALFLPGIILTRQFAGRKRLAEILARSLFFYGLMIIKLMIIPLVGLRAIGIIRQ